MKKNLLKFSFLLPVIIFPTLIFAQEQPEIERGLDERVNEWFAPIANWFERVVFFPIQFTDTISVPFVVILLVAGAVFFTVYFTFINIRLFPLAISVVRGKYDYLDARMPPAKSAQANVSQEGDIPDTIKDESSQGEVSHFQALATAVSGIVGLGNIAGVAVAIALGGPGATFWMIICGLIGMSTKFVECTLGVKYRDVDANGTVYGGPMYYLSRGLKGTKAAFLGKPLAILFAMLCIGGSFGGGNAFQSNQASAQIISMTGFDNPSAGFYIGLVLAIIVGLVIIGGIKRIAQVTEKIVPFMAGIYIIASLIIIFAHFSLIDDAIMVIIDQAFTPAAGLGGFFGVMIQG
nr:alanine:cation symporter family protein [Chitinophagaceae bacterium]